MDYDQSKLEKSITNDQLKLIREYEIRIRLIDKAILLFTRDYKNKKINWKNGL